MEHYLKNEFLEFWNSLVENGEVRWNIDKNGIKKLNNEASTVQLGRYIWFYSYYANEFNDNNALTKAYQIYNCAKANYMIEDTGAYIISKEIRNYHLYYNSFMLYGMCELYLSTHDDDIKKDIDKLVEFIQMKFYDVELNMYKEELSLDLMNMDINSLEMVPEGFNYTSNTIIHLLEAYTNLCKIENSYAPMLENIITILMTKFYNYAGYWAPYISYDDVHYMENISYGHDIETVWLVIEAMNTIGIPLEKYIDKLLKVVKNVEDEALLSSGFIKGEKVNNISAWWVFAESIVGFYYAKKYLGYDNENYLKIWQYVKENVIDKIEWCGLIDENGNKIEYPYASPWKTPYHNGRMLMKMYKNIEEQ